MGCIEVSLVNRLNEDDHISGEYPAEPENKAPAAVETRTCRHFHAVEGTDEPVHQAADLKVVKAPHKKNTLIQHPSDVEAQIKVNYEAKIKQKVKIMQVFKFIKSY